MKDDVGGIPVDVRADGVLWAINRTLLHPRGFALGYDEAHREFFLFGDGSEPWRYAETTEVDDPAAVVEEDRRFAAFEALLGRARRDNPR